MNIYQFLRRSLTTDEWERGLEFLTRTGQVSDRPLREFGSLADVFGLSALIEMLNNPRVGHATESSFLGPFFSKDAPDRSSSFHLFRRVARRSSHPRFLLFRIFKQ